MTLPAPYWRSACGRYTLYCGDCLDILPHLSGVDAVVTDPPYLTGDSRVPIRGRGVAERVVETESVGMPWGYSLDWINACPRPRHWIVYANYQMLGGLLVALDGHARLGCVFAWRKSNAPNMTRPVPRLDCEFVVWARDTSAACDRMGEFRSMVIDVPMPQAGCMADERLTQPDSGAALHPCQKPVAVVYPFVDRIEADTILDPYAGTGTTGVACVKANRRFIGIEIEERYCAIARRRIEEEANHLFASKEPK